MLFGGTRAGLEQVAAVTLLSVHFDERVARPSQRLAEMSTLLELKPRYRMSSTLAEQRFSLWTVHLEMQPLPSLAFSKLAVTAQLSVAMPRPLGNLPKEMRVFSASNASARQDRSIPIADFTRHALSVQGLSMMRKS